jgi:hypothetical protein
VQVCSTSAASSARLSASWAGRFSTAQFPVRGRACSVSATRSILACSVFGASPLAADRAVRHFQQWLRLGGQPAATSRATVTPHAGRRRAPRPPRGQPESAGRPLHIAVMRTSAASVATAPQMAAAACTASWLSSAAGVGGGEASASPCASSRISRPLLHPTGCARHSVASAQFFNLVAGGGCSFSASMSACRSPGWTALRVRRVFELGSGRRSGAAHFRCGPRSRRCARSGAICRRRALGVGMMRRGGPLMALSTSSLSYPRKTCEISVFCRRISRRWAQRRHEGSNVGAAPILVHRGRTASRFRGLMRRLLGGLRAQDRRTTVSVAIRTRKGA